MLARPSPRPWGEYGKGIERIFHSKTEVARPAAGRFETLKLKEMEAERIDRLTNPSNYQGK
ncbi:MAG: hypothetical protein L0Z50_04130 [Verrucomicrobiales bacterium]|nr:hypothetical protein [Verrucomicrobiales bacterium]